MHAGLTTADKGALLDAKARGDVYAVFSDSGKLLGSYKFYPRRTEDGVIMGIDTALAQIAEMELTERAKGAFKSACETNERYEKIINPPLTWNERINQMTVEEKAPYFVYEDTLIDWEDDYNGDSTSTETPIYRSSLASDMFFYIEQDAIDETIKLLNSPYTEGEKE